MLGVLVLITSAWWLATAKQIWADYQKYYKKLPKSKHNLWREPKESYYNFSRFILMPFGFAVGSMLIYLGWLITVPK